MALLCGALPRAEAETDRAQEILERALDRAEEWESKAELRFECMIDSVFESLGNDGEVTETAVARHFRYPLEGRVYEELVSRDGKALNDSEIKDERRRREKFIRETRKMAKRGETSGEDSPREIRLSHRLMRRYELTLIGDELLRGRECWVLGYHPRDGPLPTEGRMSRALNKTTGQLWVTKDESQVARITMEMRTPIRYLWGLFATLRSAIGWVEFDAVEPGVWAPIQFEMEIDVRVLAGVKAIRRRFRREWVDWTPTTQAPGTTTSEN